MHGQWNAGAARAPVAGPAAVVPTAPSLHTTHDATCHIPPATCISTWFHRITALHTRWVPGGGAHRRAGGRACPPSVLPATTRSKRETSGSCLTQSRCVRTRPGGGDAGGGVGGDCAPGNSNYRLFYDSAPSAACEVVVSGSGHFQFLDRQSLLQQAVCAQVRFRHPHLPQLQFARLCPRGHRGHRQLTRGSCRSCPAAAVVCPGDPLKPCGSSGLYAHRDCQWCKQWLLGTACRFGYWYH